MAYTGQTIKSKPWDTYDKNEIDTKIKEPPSYKFVEQETVLHENIVVPDNKTMVTEGELKLNGYDIQLGTNSKIKLGE